MIVSRIQLYCDQDHGVEVYFPDEGPVDGQIFTAAMLREDAKEHGWGRANDGARPVDLCPDCLKDHKRSMRKKLRTLPAN